MPPPDDFVFLRLPVVDRDEIRQTRERIMGASLSKNSLSAYSDGWRAFRAWCAAAHCDALPAHAETVCDFLAWCINAGYRFETVSLRWKAINHFHREAKLLEPDRVALRSFLRKARRDLKEERGGKRALTYDLLRRIVLRLPDTATGIRNRALILLAFASGWRRSEVVALRFTDVAFVPQGITLLQRYSKTDQTGEGRLVGIDPGRRAVTCPVRALRAWLELRGEWDGALFTRIDQRGRATRIGLEPQGEVIYQTLKDVLAQLGEDASLYGAHSLRSGMITEAVKHGASEWAIMARTGHRCLRTLQRYVKPAKAFDLNPLAGVL